MMSVLTRKLMNQGFLLVKMKSSVRSRHDLLNIYGIFVSQQEVCYVCHDYNPVLFYDLAPDYVNTNTMTGANSEFLLFNFLFSV